ncbi:hypothetical protein EV651_1194 [Kribbella sp. VKM Ac-2571]|uniref:hypothetical protein n=1 Tax=Kribbella sp. VKM Ac-2571 TaxID=2512222 RepID=UPI001060A6A6|nr:hypothetical protein [Kribbella sp. VKM Ac-2571]TDO51077.1 hypothetical protein EV651_1194 [Kribbella sp. VKM Ac-2571]
MLDPDVLLAETFSRDRPGLTLLDIEDAALPMSWMLVEVLAQERKRLALLDEFVLRFVDAGISRETELSQILGIEPLIVRSAIADGMSRDYVDRRAAQDGDWRVALTPEGHNAATDLASVSPKELTLGYAYDRITWSVTAFPRSALIGRDEVKERGIRTLISRSNEVSESDITAAALNRLLEQQNDDEIRVEILAVKRVVAKAHLFLPIKLLVYADSEGREVQVGVVIDGELSRSHELELNKAGGAEALGIHVDVAALPDEAPIPSGLVRDRVSAAEVEQLRSMALLSDVKQARAEIVPDESKAESEQAIAELDAISVRSVGVFEHRDLLLDALTNSNQRLLIVSPWIKRAIVNDEFIALLERRLNSGVRIHIAHGYGSDDRGSDLSALRRLADLRKRFPQLFFLVRLSNTHAKILIWDENWITTSFNWLSFKGDRERTYRMEEGTLVRIPEQVNEAYSRYCRLIEDGLT